MKRIPVTTFIIIAVCAIGACVYAFWPKLYGNDVESIEKIISKQERIKSKVSVFDLVDIKNYRTAGFFEGDPETDIATASMGIAVFQEDEDGNYIFKSMYRGKGAAVSQDRIIVEYVHYDDVQSNMAGVAVVISNNPQLAEVKRVINGEDVTSAAVENNPSITLLEVPSFYSDNIEVVSTAAGESTSESPANLLYSAEFFFYDKDGNIIE